MLALFLALASLGVGETAPPLDTLELLQSPGVVGRLAWREKQPMVVQFWATWCEACLGQIPHWNTLARKFTGRVRFVSISAEDPETVGAFLKKRPIAGWVALDLEGTAHQSWGAETIPVTFLVDAQGMVLARTSLSALREEDLEALAAGRAMRSLGPPEPGEKARLLPDRVPRLLRPLGDTPLRYAVTFEWTPVAGAAAYRIQVADEEEFAEPYLDTAAPDPHYRANLLIAGPLWWRVCALDEHGKPGPWSVVRKLEILPPPLAESVRSVTLFPTATVGGGSVSGIVTLDEPAPAAGATVPLSASDGSRVSMPARVLLASGDTSAPFLIATEAVSGSAEVRIQARSRKETRSAVLRIAPPGPPAVIRSLGIFPAVLPAGGAAQGMVMLSGPVPVATAIRLETSDASRASVPSEVAIPARASAAAFVVQSAHSTTAAEVVITASFDGTVKTATVDVTAADSQGLLPAPVPAAPFDGAAVVRDGSNEFVWSGVTGAASYTIELVSASDYGSGTPESRNVPVTRLIIAPLARGMLWWRVRANDANGSPGRWSEPRLVRVR
jgi:thiol-disulfide isomerase/thioredoxin